MAMPVFLKEKIKKKGRKKEDERETGPCHRPPQAAQIEERRWRTAQKRRGNKKKECKVPPSINKGKGKRVNRGSTKRTQMRRSGTSRSCQRRRELRKITLSPLGCLLSRELGKDSNPSFRVEKGWTC